MTEENENLINIIDDDGNELSCILYDIIDFEDSQYALLLEANAKEEEEPEFVLMRYVEENEEGYFETIDDDEEFERVSNYIENLGEEEETEE